MSATKIQQSKTEICIICVYSYQNPTLLD